MGRVLNVCIIVVLLSVLSGCGGESVNVGLLENENTQLRQTLAEKEQAIANQEVETQGIVVLTIEVACGLILISNLVWLVLYRRRRGA